MSRRGRPAAFRVASRFADAEAPAAHDLLHTDVVLEDMVLRTQVLGRIETVAYLNRILDRAPYGRTAAAGLVGITAVECDAEGLITRITSVYDSRQREPERKRKLIAASFAR